MTNKRPQARGSDTWNYPRKHRLRGVTAANRTALDLLMRSTASMTGRKEATAMTHFSLWYHVSGGPHCPVEPLAIKFTYEQVGHEWRVYIDSAIDYRGRATSAVETHRLGLPQRPYVCWSTPIRTYDDAKTISANWAEGTLNYIATGNFDVPRRPGFTTTDSAREIERRSFELERVGDHLGPIASALSRLRATIG